LRVGAIETNGKSSVNIYGGARDVAGIQSAKRLGIVWNHQGLHFENLHQMSELGR